MKVLEKGTGQDWKLQVKCEYVEDCGWDEKKEHCGSLLEVDKNDIERHYYSRFGGTDSGVDYLVTCPECGCKIYIDYHRLPVWVQSYADEHNSYGGPKD